MDELTKWVGTVAAACIAAYIGSLVALSRAKKEKMWIQKQEAYLSIIDSLHNLIIWADEEYAANFPHPLPTVGEEKLEELRRNQGKALDILRKHVHLGELIVSKDASEKIESLLSEYFSAEGDLFFDFVGDERSEEVSKHYQRLRACRKAHRRSKAHRKTRPGNVKKERTHNKGDGVRRLTARSLRCRSGRSPSSAAHRQR